MKKLGLIAALAFVLGACGNDSPSEVVGYKTTIEVDKVKNVGKIARGEVIHVSFDIKNTGEYPLVFSDVSGSCSCTATDWPKDPIAPGDVATIKADVKTENFSEGAVTRSVTILANTTPADTKLIIEATIIN